MYVHVGGMAWTPYFAVILYVWKCVVAVRSPLPKLHSPIVIEPHYMDETGTVEDRLWTIFIDFGWFFPSDSSKCTFTGRFASDVGEGGLFVLKADSQS